MSPLVVIFLTVFIDLLGFGIIIPLLPFYAEAFGASAFVVGMLSTSFSVAQFLFAPMWGRLSDRIGRRPVILIGLAGSCLSYLIFGLAHSLAVLFIARTAAGIAGANIPTAQAYMADITTPENRAKGMGLVGAAFGLGFIFGPAIGGFLSQWGYAMPAFFASGLSLVNLVAAWILLPESRTVRNGQGPRLSRVAALRAALTRPHLPQVLLVYFVIVAAFSAFEATFALYAERRFAFDARTIGYVFAFVGVVLSIVQGLLVGRTVRLVREQRLVPGAILVIAVGMGMYPFVHSVPLLFVATGILSIGMGFNSPTITALISKLSSADDQGGILGVSQSLASLARIAGPAWGGFVFDRYGPGAPFASSAGLLLVAFALAAVTLAHTTIPGQVRR